MAIYLIDYENTGVKGLAGIEKLNEEDQIILFYGPKTGSIPFDEHVKISQTASHVEYIKTTKTAKNYLDFQLVTYLGYLIARSSIREYHIVSKDSGYDSVIDFWSKKGLVMKRQDAIAGEDKTVSQAQSKATATKSRKKVKQQNRKQESAKQEKLKQESPKQESLKQVQRMQSAETVVAETADVADVATEAAKPHEGQSADNTVTANRAEGMPESAGSREKEMQMPSSVPESVRKKIRAVLKTENLQGGVYKQIYACMLAARDKQTFNTALVRAFTQEKGNHYYKTLLQIFQEWKQKG